MDDNRREHPRFSTRIPLEVVLPDGEVIHTGVDDLSMGGLRFGCGPDACEDLFPNGPRLVADQPTQVDVRLTLPFPGRDPEDVDAACRAVHVVRENGSGYRVGLQFTSISPECLESLENYLLECHRYAS